MTTAIVSSKSTEKIDQQIREARAVLRGLHETLDDPEDIRLQKGKKQNAGKPETPWVVVAKELGIKPLSNHRRRSQS